MEVSRLSSSAGLALLVGACILTQGCGTTPQGGYGTAPPSAACERIATLRLAGARRVFLNGKQAEDGAAVCNGDRVSTGADSSAFVQLPRGGLVVDGLPTARRTVIRGDEYIYSAYDSRIEQDIALVRRWLVSESRLPKIRSNSSVTVCIDFGVVDPITVGVGIAR